MIRLRIEKEVKTFSKEGLIWYKGGRPYQVVIEQQVATFDPAVPKGMDCYPETWVSVEVIDAEKN